MKKKKASLGLQKLIAFVAVSDPERTRSFYRDTLGLELVREELPFALVFNVGGTMLRATISPEVMPDPYTVLGWEVSDIEAVRAELVAAGVKFQFFPAIKGQNDDGIWTAPNGARIGWFKDPDGNLLSITQF